MFVTIFWLRDHAPHCRFGDQGATESETEVSPLNTKFPSHFMFQQMFIEELLGAGYTAAKKIGCPRSCGAYVLAAETRHHAVK